jgi:putative peptidoglycan lipid II flippase
MREKRWCWPGRGRRGSRDDTGRLSQSLDGDAVRSMMKLGPQTAIRGVFSVGLINIVARVIAYGKHIAITALIGLSAQLDAFYMATTVLGLTIFVFADVFDSACIPRLVRTLQADGEEKFRDLAGSVLAFAFVLAACLAVLLSMVAPWTPWIAPGFSAEKKSFVLGNLLYLAPMAVLFLPYHAMGAVLRARRRFQAFYLGEIVIAVVTLVIVLARHDLPYVIPVSFSAAYAAAFLYVAAVARGAIRFRPSFREDAIREIVRMLFRLLPVYLVFHLFTLVDRTFASYLPTGGVSALAYGLMIVLIPSTVLMMENVFITPLAESPEREDMMRRIVEGVLIVSVPMAFFATAYADPIVAVAFERGVFTAGSTKMTGDALAFFAVAIPGLFLWPIFYRLFQILGKLGSITAVACLAVALNGGLNYLFMTLGLGVKGIALATSLSEYALVLGSVILLRRAGISVATKGAFSVLLMSLAIGAGALGATFAVPLDAGTPAGLFVRAALFTMVSAALFYLAPSEGVRRWRETVLNEILPARRGRAAAD